jgi:periplasmic divalent cation tolerance protein
MQPAPPVSMARLPELANRPARAQAGTMSSSPAPLLYLAQTTVDQAGTAERLAAEAVQARLAICAQVAGPITSYYWWAGRQEQAQEWRVVFKLRPEQRDPLTAWIGSTHPYTVPEWLVQEVNFVGEKYLSWAREQPTSVNL